MNRNYRDVRLVFVGFSELNCAVNECEEGVVLTHAYIFAGVVDSASLANYYVTSLCELATEYLET